MNIFKLFKKCTKQTKEPKIKSFVKKPEESACQRLNRLFVEQRHLTRSTLMCENQFQLRNNLFYDNDYKVVGEPCNYANEPYFTTIENSGKLERITYPVISMNSSYIISAEEYEEIKNDENLIKACFSRIVTNAIDNAYEHIFNHHKLYQRCAISTYTFYGQEAVPYNYNYKELEMKKTSGKYALKPCGDNMKTVKELPYANGFQLVFQTLIAKK